MKQFFKNILKKFDSALSALGYTKIDEITAVDKGMQILLSLKYKELLQKKSPLPSFDEVQFRSYSQNGEDGILLYLFSLIGTTNKKVVELCAGDGIHCNSANLIVNHGWDGLLFDGNKTNTRFGKFFYSTCRDTFAFPPKLVHAWITMNNVNRIIRKNGFEEEIDLLSLDMDGVDYWIWKAIDCIKPRVVVVEHQCVLGPDRSLTVPYKPDFKAEYSGYAPIYAGASLKAFVKLGKEKGYRLVGCERYGFNAFFIRSDIAKGLFPEIKIEECFKHPLIKHNIKHYYPKVKNKKWIKV